MTASRPGLGPVASLTRRDAVLHQLRRAILAGELEPGERLREVQLAHDLGVSRPTLREALYQLIHEGLLVQEPYKGIAVAAIDAATITDVAAVRVALETVAARAIAADRTGESQAGLRAAWADYERAVDGDDPGLQHEAHLALHRAIWLLSGNTVLQRIWPIVSASINLAVSTDQVARGDLKRARRAHRTLLDAILSNRVRDIDREVRAHIRASADELVTIISREG
jgi:DNA-binding GntR family transcriptional regulator